MFLGAGIVLGIALLLMAIQLFQFQSLVTSTAASGGGSLTAGEVLSTLQGIIQGFGSALLIVGLAVLLVGPGLVLGYLQRARTRAEYAGLGLLMAGRVFLAVAVWIIAEGIGSVIISNPGNPTSNTDQVFHLPATVPLVEWVAITGIIGFVLGFVGQTLLAAPVAVERSIPRTNRYERASIFVHIGALVLLALGFVLSVLGALQGFVPRYAINLGGGYAGSVGVIGYGFVLFAIWAFVGAASEMLHAFAYAEQPLDTSRNDSPPASTPPPVSST